MTNEKQAVKILAEELAKALNNVKNNPTAINASQVVGLPSALYSVLNTLEYKSEEGDEIATKLLNYFHNIAALEVGTIAADEAQIGTLYATFGEFMHLVAQKATIGQIDVSALRADMAAIGLLTIGSAQIAQAQIDHLNTDDAFIRAGVGGKLYIDDLAVSNANIVNLAAGSIMIKDSNGDMVELYVNGQGQISTRAVSYDGDDIINTNSLNGTRIIENSITANRLNASEIFAASGNIMDLVSTNIDASKISTGSLNAGIVKTGVLGDVAGKNYWNMVTGDFSLSGSATVGGQSIATALDIANLQDQIDGNITTWFYSVDPTISNPPARDWDTPEKKNEHLGDLYYNTTSGYCWRWQVINDVYSWGRITDSDVTKALADSAEALDLADNKRRVFVAQPAPPYDVGDLWVQGTSGDIMRCQTAKAESASYAVGDWVKASKYTDDTAVTTLDGSLNQQGVFNRLTNNGQDQGIYLQNGKVYINGEYLKANSVNAGNIHGGTLVLGGANDVNGVLKIYDDSGNQSGFWNNSGISISKGSLYFPTGSSGSDYISLNRGNPFSCQYTDTSNNKVYKININNYGMLFGSVENNTPNLRISDTNITANISNNNDLGFNIFNFIGSATNQHNCGVEIRGENDSIIYLRLERKNNSRTFVFPYGTYIYSYENGEYELKTQVSYQGIITDGFLGVGGNVTFDSPLGISSGGTGANNAADARTNLDITPANIGAVALSGSTMTGDLLFSDSGTSIRQIRGIVGANDYWRIAGGATAANGGWMEIATADDGNEPIYVRQYTGTYATVARTLTLLDASGNTTFPGTVITTGGGLGNSSYPWSDLWLNGAINYKGIAGNYTPISFKDSGDAYGLGVIIGAGGLICIGGGESANTVAASISSGGSEQLCLSNDNGIDFYTGCQNGINSATHIIIDYDGTYIHPHKSVSYIAGAKGSGAALYAKKNYNADAWYPAVALETKGGGAWQIGNYNDETLEFQYATKANRDSNTNTTSEIYMQNGDTGRVMTSGNYTNWTVTKTGSGASGTWGIGITGNAANVTGTVDIDHGGTGATTKPNARKALFGDAMADKTQYFITINDNWANGGYITNAKAAEIIKSNASGTWGIGITGNAANVTGKVEIGNGGTGATSASGARSNLGIKSKSESYSLTSDKVCDMGNDYAITSRTVIAVGCTSATVAVVPYINNSHWWLAVRKLSDFTAPGNTITSVTVTVTYIQL